MRRIASFVLVIFRSVRYAVRVERLLEQAVFAVCLIWALHAWVITDGLPYATFLLCGLAPWFYYREILFDLPGHPQAFAPHLRHGKASCAALSSCQALAALPTLLFWMLAAVVVHLISGAALKNPLLLIYMLLCNVYNAMAQGVLLSAFAPLFQGTIGIGLSITLPFLFWTTPLAWPFQNAEGIFLLMMQANPLYYLADGFRCALMSGTLPSTAHTLVFFVVASGAGLLGIICTRRVWRGAFSVEDS